MTERGNKIDPQDKAKAQLVMQITGEALHHKAINHHLEGDLEEAENNYRGAIEKGYWNCDTYLNLGVICVNSGREDEAIRLYHQAIKIDPNDPDAYRNLGNLYFRLGNFKDAAAICRKSIEINSDNSEALLTLGWSCKELGNLDEALSSTLKSLDLKPNNPTALMNLGGIYVDLGEYTNALYYTQKSIEIEKDNSKALLNLGWIYFHMGKLNQAESSLQRALKINSLTEAACHRALALVNCAKGDIKEAETWLDRALKKEPHSSENKIIKIAILSKKNRRSTSYFGELKTRKCSKNISDFIAISNIPVDQNLIESLRKIKAVDLNDLNEPTFGNATGSSYNFFEENLNATKDIRKQLKACAEGALSSRVYFTDSFFTILSGNGKVEKHAHITTLDKHKNLNLGENKYALVYYLSAGEEDCTEPGILRLYEPDDYIKPRSGMVVIIPARRYHSVDYNGTKDRIIIGVNFYATKPLEEPLS